MTGSLITRIARKEFTEFVRDGRSRSAAVILGLLLGVSLLAGWSHVTAVAAEHDEARQATRTQWLKQPPKNPHSAAHYGVFAFKPQSALAIVDSGVDPYVGVAALLEAHRQNDFKYKPAVDRTAVQRFGDFTPALVMQVLMPLMIVLLAFGAFVGEREDGVWRQVLASGVSPRTVLAGKALGVAAGLGLICAPAAVLAAALVSSTGPGVSIGADIGRIAAVSAVYLVWCAVWLSATFLVSARAHSSRQALVVLLGLWMFATLMAPRLSGDLAAWWHPTPTAAEFQKALDADLGDTAARQARVAAKREALLAEHGVSTVEELPINFSGVSLQEGEEFANEAFDVHFGRLYDTFERQNRVAHLASVVAPSLALRSVSMGLSGTDFQQHRDFVTAAEEYRRDMQRRLNGDVALHQKPGETYLADEAMWASVPDFDYQPRPVGAVVQQQTLPLLVLVGWMVLLMFGAAVSVGRSTEVVR